MAGSNAALKKMALSFYFSALVYSTVFFCSSHSLWSTERASGLMLYLERFWRVCGGAELNKIYQSVRHVPEAEYL